MFNARFQDLMIQGFSISNKIYFKEFDQHEFEVWITECRSLLSLCEPEPYFPWSLDPHHIEELVMLLMHTLHQICRGEIEYQGI